jgi:hypothetical protein
VDRDAADHLRRRGHAARLVALAGRIDQRVLHAPLPRRAVGEHDVDDARHRRDGAIGGEAPELVLVHERALGLDAASAPAVRRRGAAARC